MGGQVDTERTASRRDADEAPVAPDTGDEARSTRFTGAGAIPPVLGFTGSVTGPSASDRAYGLPLVDAADLKAHASRMEAERLLTSSEVTSGADAVAGLEVLLDVPDAQRGRVIDRLAQRAFDNLVDRLADDQRARLSPLVEASQDPRRKVKLWAAQHTSRARNDLARYKSDFGDPESGEQTDKQLAAAKRFTRRETGVEATEAEVAKECQLLLAKGDKLTLEDVDKMRARKDRELDVEIKHNINLVAEAAPRPDGSRVVWEQEETAQLDSALDKLPDQHVHDENSVQKYVRRANRHMMSTRAGEYAHNEVSVYDRAHDAIPGRAQAPSIEYDVTHEIGHEVETENTVAFEKFKKAAGWQKLTRAELGAKGIKDADIGEMSKPHRVGDKVYKRDDEGSFHAADETAIPARGETRSDRWDYAHSSAQEHWAELYAMAVHTPELLYSDYIAMPAEQVRALRQTLANQHEQLRNLGPASTRGAAMTLKIQDTERALVRAEKIVRQRRELYDIIRNDVFGATKETRAAVERLRTRGVGSDGIRAFEEKAAHVSTPQQIAQLEREAMR